MDIPRLIHRIWLGPRDLPYIYRTYGDRWLELHPGWTVVEWDAGMLAELPMRNRELYDAIGVTEQPVPGAAKADSIVEVQRADIASYELLWEYGGVYVNCDLEPLRTLEPLLAGHDCVLARENSDFISNAVMAATPHHPFIGTVLDIMRDQFDRQRGRSINEQTGPYLLTRAWDAWPADDRPVVAPAEAFNPWLYATEGEPHPDSYAVHHWGHATPDDRLWSDQ